MKNHGSMDKPQGKPKSFEKLPAGKVKPVLLGEAGPSKMAKNVHHAGPKVMLVENVSPQMGPTRK